MPENRGAPPGAEGRGSASKIKGPAVEVPFKIVTKYEDPTTANLKFTVKAGTNTFDVDLVE
jgi:hypothetical protein